MKCTIEKAAPAAQQSNVEKSVMAMWCETQCEKAAVHCEYRTSKKGEN
jgi:hypothetical protein